MAKKRNVKTVGAAFAPPASAADRIPTSPSREVDMADALENSASGLGLSRDKRYYSEYGTVVRLSDYQLRSRWRGSWLAKKIVATPAEDMTREWVKRSWEKVKPDDLKALARAEKRHSVRTKMRIGITWGGLFGGGAMIMFIRGQRPDEPLEVNSVKKGSLQSLQVRDRTQIYAEGGAPDQDPNSPNWGKPLFYRVRGSSMRIHWTRVIRFEGALVPDDDFLANGFWHDSELQAVDTALKDFDGAVENVASMMWEAKVDVIKTALANMLAMKDGGALLRARYAEASLGKGNHRILLLNKDEEYTSHTMSFGGVNDLLGSYVVFTCGAAGLPMVKLFGQSAPGMNSTGQVDEGLYYDRIAGEQGWKLFPQVERLDEVLVRDALGFFPDGYELEANPLEQVSPKDQAEIDLKNAQRDEKYHDIGVATPGLIARNLKARGTYGQAMSDEDVKAAEELDEPLDDDVVAEEETLRQGKTKSKPAEEEPAA